MIIQASAVNEKDPDCAYVLVKLVKKTWFISVRELRNRGALIVSLWDYGMLQFQDKANKFL